MFLQVSGHSHHILCFYFMSDTVNKCLFKFFKLALLADGKSDDKVSAVCLLAFALML